MEHFLLQPGIWMGEGHASFPTSQEKVRFFTRWRLQGAASKTLNWLQEVELYGLVQTNYNYFSIFDIQGEQFKIILENEMIGKVEGKGIFDNKMIAWELRNHPGMEGYEIYEIQTNGDYLFKAEYSSPERLHTFIDGKIWKKST